MKFVEFFVLSLLWLGIAISPALLGAILGALLGASGGLLGLTIFVTASIGFIFGALWAEKIRKSIGLARFWGRLLGARDNRA